MAALRNSAINISDSAARPTSPPPTAPSATDPPTSSTPSPQPDRRLDVHPDQRIHDFAGALVAHLLNLDLDIVFVDTTSTYFETETADADIELADPVTDDEATNPVEAGVRAFGHSKDSRDDLPQVVLAMAVTRDGVPVRCWTFAGNTADTAIIRTVKDDLTGWNLRRLVWVADRGFASAANRAYLTRGGGHYIHP